MQDLDTLGIHLAGLTILSACRHTLAVIAQMAQLADWVERIDAIAREKLRSGSA